MYDYVHGLTSTSMSNKNRNHTSVASADEK